MSSLKKTCICSFPWLHKGSQTPQVHLQAQIGWTQWNKEFTLRLLQFGFHQSVHDYCLFTKGTGSHFLALIVYVDDILLTEPNEEGIEAAKSFLENMFTIKDLGHVKYFLMLEIARSSTGMYPSQKKYITDIIINVSLLTAKLSIIPLRRGFKLSKDNPPTLMKPKKYRILVGCLLYLNLTIPVVSFAVQQLSQFM